MTIKQLEDFENYKQTELHTDSLNIMTKIKDVFKPYSDLYLQMYEKEISKEYYLNKTKLLLEDKTGNELRELKSLGIMFSERNCTWVEYNTVNIIMEMIQSLIFPELNMEYLIQINKYIKVNQYKYIDVED